jgi:hypothetical protein
VTTESLEFSTTEIPSEIPFVDDGSQSDDLTCDVCGVPLTYAGRGRKPTKCDTHKRKSSGTTTRRGSADVELAVTSLHSLYEGFLFPLTAVSPIGAQVWANQIDALDERNRAFLATNRDLVRKINAAATKGGTTAFVISHVVAVAPVVMAVRADFAHRAATRAAAQEEAEPEHFSQVV